MRLHIIILAISLAGCKKADFNAQNVRQGLNNNTGINGTDGWPNVNGANTGPGSFGAPTFDPTNPNHDPNDPSTWTQSNPILSSGGSSNGSLGSGGGTFDPTNPNHDPNDPTTWSNGNANNGVTLSSGSDLAPNANGGGLLSGEGFDCLSTQQGLIGRVYRLPTGTSSLPNFASLNHIGIVDAPQLNVPARSWTSGFPGVPNLIEWFGIEFHSVLNVPATGTYFFRTTSDDGSKVYVDNNLVLNNDGVHAPQTRDSAGIFLTQGLHRFKVEWFQGPKVQIALQVFWRSASSGFKILNSELIAPDNCTDTKLGTFN